MYNYKQFGLDVLTSALNIFENKHQNNISSETMDKIWDVTLRVQNNHRVKRVMGRYFTKAKRIEIFPNQFHNNLMAFKDTVLHELAHHITNILYGYDDINSHGPEWKSICNILGCEPSATKDMVAFNERWQASKNIHYYKQYLLK